MEFIDAYCAYAAGINLGPRNTGFDFILQVNDTVKKWCIKRRQERGEASSSWCEVFQKGKGARQS